MKRGLGERVWAWLYTGPLGHLYGIVADISLMWVRYGWSRVKARRSTHAR